MENKTIKELKKDLYYYENELKEYFNGCHDSYVRDLEYTIKEIKKELKNRGVILYE